MFEEELLGGARLETSYRARLHEAHLHAEPVEIFNAESFLLSGKHRFRRELSLDIRILLTLTIIYCVSKFLIDDRNRVTSDS